MRDSVSFASRRSAGSAIDVPSADTNNKECGAYRIADSDDPASVSILKGITLSKRSSRPSSIYSKSAMVSSEHAEKQSIQSKNSTKYTKSTPSNDERDDYSRHVLSGAAADTKRDGNHDVFAIAKAIPSSVRTPKQSNAAPMQTYNRSVITSSVNDAGVASSSLQPFSLASIRSRQTTASKNQEEAKCTSTLRDCAFANQHHGDIVSSIPSFSAVSHKSKAAASVSSDKPSISSKKPETSKISSTSVSKSSKSNKSMLSPATNPVSLEFWTGLSVRVTVAVLQAGGSGEIAQKAASVVLAIGKNHEGRQHDAKTMIALSTKLSSIIPDAGGSAEVAAAASLAVMKSVECNDNIHANGGGSLSGSFHSLRKGKSNAKSNKPETPSVALSLNSMRKQLKAKDIETDQKLKTFEDEELRHRQWEKKVKERVEARRGKEKVELEVQQEILMALEKQNELMRRRLEEKQNELKQREEDRMKKSEEERRQKEKEFTEMSTYFAERERDIMERINAITMREDGGLQKEKDTEEAKGLQSKSKGFIRNFLEVHNLHSISDDAMDLYSINDEAMEITHSLSDEDINAIMMGREMAEKPGMLHMQEPMNMQNNIYDQKCIEGSEFMNAADKYGNPHTETYSGRDKRGAGTVSARQDAELVSFARSSFLNKTKEKSNEKKRQSLYENFTNSLVAATDLVTGPVTDFDYEKFAQDLNSIVSSKSQFTIRGVLNNLPLEEVPTMGSSHQLTLSQEADSSSFGETLVSSEEEHSQLPLEDGTDESVTKKPKRGVTERLKSAFWKKELRQPMPSVSRSVSFDPSVSFGNKQQKMQNRGASNQKLIIHSVSPGRQRLSRSQQMIPSTTTEKEKREMKRGGSKSFFWKKEKKMLEEGERKKQKGGFTKRLKSVFQRKEAPEGSSPLSPDSSAISEEKTTVGQDKNSSEELSYTSQSQSTCTRDTSSASQPTIHDSWSKC
ncbi:hypothetical protein ACHAWC_011784 [Mediolabrus comicus]